MFKRFSLLIILVILLAGCESVNDERIPYAMVKIDLSNQGLWDIYGVHGYGQYRYFIREEKIPSNYPYTALTYTGFGGVLLISGRSHDDYNAPLAYDMACPVEAKNNVRIAIDPEKLEAYCPKCMSRYDVCEGDGRPISGEALTRNYGLTKYRVFSATNGGYTIGR